jgi:hypothetical protein
VTDFCEHGRKFRLHERQMNFLTNTATLLLLLLLLLLFFLLFVFFFFGYTVLLSLTFSSLTSPNLSFCLRIPLHGIRYVLYICSSFLHLYDSSVYISDLM